jgi:Tol biopolymer transport system component
LLSLVSLLLSLALLIPASAGAADEIAYNCGDDICVINPDAGGSVTNLTETAAGTGNEQWPTWSPDGTRIAYRGFYYVTGNEETNVYVLDPAEAAPRNPIDVSQNTDRDVDFAAPAWSPDGTRIAWSATADSSATSPQTGLYIGASAGTSLPYRIGTNREGSHPTWSADGATVAFGSPGGIYLTSGLTSGAATFLPNGLGLAPQWSPNGQWIATEGTSYPYKVRIVAADGSGSHELPRPIDSTGAIDWSADSTRLTYVADEEPSADQVRVVPADGSNAGVVISMPLGWIVPHNPKLSPDGTRVVFTARLSSGPGYEQLLVAPSDGSAVATPLTMAAEQSTEPDWKPTGTNPNPPVNPGGGTGGAAASGGGASGKGPPATQAPKKVNLAYFKEPRILSSGGVPGHLLAVSVDCHAQGGHPTGWVAEFCAANASAYARGVAPAGLRPNARAKGGGKKVLFAKGAVKVKEGKKKPLLMKITPEGQKLLKKGKPLHLTLSVSSKRGNGPLTKSTKTVTVTPPRPKH